MISVVIADDQALVRAGFRALLDAQDDIEVTGEAADGDEAVRLALEHRPDVVLMDLSMPVLDGVAATRKLLAQAPKTRVLALTSFSDRQRVADVIAAGATGYLLKDCAPDELVAAIRSSAAGHSPFDPRVAGALLPTSTRSPAENLSSRELEVLRHAARGLANKQIARKLGISESTVKVHLGSVFRRIGVTDRTSAALWARQNLPDES